MKLITILRRSPEENNPILEECSQFLKESGGYPVLKNLPSNYNDFHKVKVRQRKRKDKFTQTFNEAFEEIPNLRQRAVIVNGEFSFKEEQGDREPFYVFLPDGYKYKYSLEVTNSQKDYQDAFEKILDLFEDNDIIERLLKYTYTSKELKEGITHGSEIIFYNVPYFYAIRTSTQQSYHHLLESLDYGIRRAQVWPR